MACALLVRALPVRPLRVRPLVLRTLVVRTLVALAALALGSLVAAQDGEVQRAISAAAGHPMFAAGLAQHPGWTATAYDARDRYGLWRVDFFAADGEQLGWAQVRLVDGRMFAWETGFGLEGDAYARAEEALLDFLRDDPGFRDLAGDVDDREWVWVGYEEWRDTWVVHIERGADSVIVILRSEDEWARSLERLHIVQVQVPGVVAVEEWRSRRSADAIALAFTEPRVAAAVRGLEGWTTEAEALDWDVWRVSFVWEGRTVARADVDLVERSVLVRE